MTACEPVALSTCVTPDTIPPLNAPCQLRPPSRSSSSVSPSSSNSPKTKLTTSATSPNHSLFFCKAVFTRIYSEFGRNYKTYVMITHRYQNTSEQNIRRWKMNTSERSSSQRRLQRLFLQHLRWLAVALLWSQPSWYRYSIVINIHNVLTSVPSFWILLAFIMVAKSTSAVSQYVPLHASNLFQISQIAAESVGFADFEVDVHRQLGFHMKSFSTI